MSPPYFFTQLLFFVDGIIVCHLPYGPTAYFTLSNVVMRHDIPDVGTMSEAYPHLIFHNFSSRLGERVSRFLGGAAVKSRARVKAGSHQANAACTRLGERGSNAMFRPWCHSERNVKAISDVEFT